MLGSGRELALEGADRYDRGRRAGSLGGGVGPAAGYRARPWRIAVRVPRAGVDGGLAGPGDLAGEAAGTGGGPDPRARAHRVSASPMAADGMSVAAARSPAPASTSAVVIRGCEAFR